ncbi:hypothetical protein B0O41_4020 [Propionibacteriaceae bacterium ES.041]|uniref:hypothetical protein n=1 Tax=Enemella evansiae TaxID=2016499 RepID=UPI000B9600B3|nr:hypothetical protein [Enemella evansiae]OYN96799.1 hypothetical protein CGZ96_10885 [Enemella evansiae]PFG69167.1 hypothetical protein B0O41_4020 [Propionibacteriaceae bacterium ES.041]
MALLLLTSAAGAPGVTTTALGLALHWSGDSLLVDADRQPSQAILAGHLHGVSGLGRGLTGLARVQRERRPLAAELTVHCLRLGSADEEHRRMLLPGFSHPGAPALFGPVWGELADTLHRLSLGGTGVVVDTGRIGEGLPAPLAAAADVVLVVTRCTLRQLAGVRLQLPVLQQRIDQLGSGTALGLLLIGPGNPYGAKEIAEQFGVEVWASLPEDPAAARVWSDGDPAPRRFTHSPLVKGIRSAVSSLAIRTQTTQVRS